MAKTVGYMITWTTYGTWLQGDERTYVKNGKIRLPNRGLTEANRKAQLQDAVLLTKAQQNVVRGAIVQQAKTQGHRIHALAVNATHVHVVAEYANQPISQNGRLLQEGGPPGVENDGPYGQTLDDRVRQKVLL